MCSVIDHENDPPKDYSHNVTCPRHCKKYRMQENIEESNEKLFTIDNSGNLMLSKMHPYGKVKHLLIRSKTNLIYVNAILDK